MPTVSIVSSDLTKARQFARLFGASRQDGSVVVHVHTKYFDVGVTLVPGSQALADVDGVVYLSNAVPEFASSTRLVLHALVALSSLSERSCEALHSACVANGCELICGGDPFSPIEPAAATAGLLDGDVGGASRVWQLLHQTMWPKTETVANSENSQNCVLVVGNSTSLRDRLSEALRMEGCKFSNKYFSVVVDFACRDHNISIRYGDILRAEFAWLHPCVVVFGSVTDARAYMSIVDIGSVPGIAVVADQGDEDENVVCSERFERVCLDELPFDQEYGARGAERVREVFDCAQWDDVTDCADVETPALAPAEHQRTSDTVSNHADLVVVLAGASVADGRAFLKAVISGMRDDTTTCEVRNAYGSAVVRYELVDIAAAKPLCARAHAVVVLLGSDATDVSSLFAESLEDYDPASDERVRLVVGDRAAESLTSLASDAAFAVEALDTSDPEGTLARCKEAMETCVWPTFVAAKTPPKHLVFSCEPPPGFRTDAAGRTVRMEDAGQDDWEKLAAEMREQRASAQAMPDEDRKRR
eukprot:CAMPEP_0174838854 /NCGR_PEP_ID=MMETSP1114-20130205/7665_1 /TAXON_ID=312471 /ORGANISM="Neobodo designis, Strain CCAP 1951/1" /LENGTH=531 /DNA_ID=CAMNT_0016072965 /DNA_START=64 /DNA_END=1656 /DNA_ORIENTATION=+